jgi:oligopeptidase B
VDQPRPPVAERRPVEVERPTGTVVDDYAWLRDDDRDDPDVIGYLEAENAYTEAMLAHTEELQGRLYDEIVGRIKQTDVSAPTPRDGWLYYRRTTEGDQYGVHCRRPADAGPPGEETDDAEQVVLDENALAEGHDYLSLGGLSVSPDHRWLAYLPDFEGREVFTLHVRDLETGEDRVEVADRRLSHGVTWGADSATLYYTVQDEAQRPHEVWRHRLGGDPAGDERVFSEPDERFFVGAARTRSDAFVVIHSGSKTTDEVWLIDAHDPTAAPRLVAARVPGVEYDVDHRGDDLYITTNADGAEDFKLVRTPVDTPGREQWTDVVPHRPGTRLRGVDAFAGHVVLYERAEALTRIRVLWPETGDERVVDQPEEVYTAGPGPNHAYDTAVLRYVYTSLTTPTSVIDLDLATGERTVVKQVEVVGGYDADRYVTRREWATAPDGTQVPVSVVHAAGLELDGTAPCLLYGYGSYEHSIDPTFSSVRLSLLDRGFVFAIGHVRGGGEMGRGWYEDGKWLAKRNTFTDFVACAEHLVASGYTRPERLAIRGGSAGGLLIGATLDLRPDLFGAAVADVPFVDVVNTMSDATLPLTVAEYEEWGDPTDPAYAEYIASYSPYENVAAVDYPAMLVTAGLNDPRVGYWEPAKWVAKLRATATGTRPLLLKTELGAGHFGPSGRYDAWRREALAMAFLVDQLAPEEA